MLVLTDNPIHGLEGYRLDVLGKLPKLEKLDKEAVTAEEREEIAQLMELGKTKAA